MDRLKSTSSRSASGSTVKSPTASSEDHAVPPVPPSPMSPFHRRFRSSASDSPSSNTTSVATAKPVGPTSNSKSEAARSAKRFLSSSIRDDWEYPPAEHETGLPSRQRRPVAYRIREEGSSDPEPLSDEPYDSRDPMVFTDTDPYKFESPDAVARTTVSERRSKRRRLLQDELQWNEGLRTWTERRNAWCAAVDHNSTKRPLQQNERAETVDGLSASKNLLSSPLSTVSTVVDSSEELDSNSEAESGEDRGPLLPIFPSLLPGENVIRASIKPSMYPAIYSKVVVQALTPTVPIPLPDMIGALVQGWKAEGHWPSRSPAPSGPISLGGRRASELLKFRRRGNTVAEAGRMRKGVGAVKKALRLRTPEGEAAKAGLNFEHWDNPYHRTEDKPAP